MSFDTGSSALDNDKELQQFIELENQKAQFTARVHSFMDTCWDKCIDKPGTKLDKKEETCLVNCVERFIDTSYFIVNRLDESKRA